MSRSRRASQSENPLQSDRGSTIVQDPVVRTIAGVAANEIEGARTTTGGARLPGDTSRTVGEFVGGLAGGESRTRGVSVEVGEREAAVDLTITVDYGLPIHQIAESVRQNVIRHVENLTGLTATEVNVNVNDVILPDQRQQA